MNRIYKSLAALIISLHLFVPIAAGQSSAPMLPETKYENRINDRSEFMSYTVRDYSTAGNRTDDWNYLPVENFRIEETGGASICTYSFNAELPPFWIDRIVILHTEGARNSHSVYVNDSFAGSSRDSRTPSEFDITSHLTRGVNNIRIEVLKDTDEPESALEDERDYINYCFLYSQPRTRIWDYSFSATPRESDGELVLNMDLEVENLYSGQETFTVGFDIFSPSGRLEEYGLEDVTLEGGERKTVSFSAVVYGANNRQWSASKPELYSITFFVRKGGRVLEYVPAKTSFGSTEHRNGIVYRNGEAVDLKPTSYNAVSAAELRKDIVRLKKEGYNVLCPDYPQPYWFYFICDEMGMYVVDQANISTDYKKGDIRIGGNLSNDPAWLPEYMERTQAMYYRSHNHPCIIGWSLGGDSGNGYNMYKTYEWLRSVDPDRPIVYRGANGEWNNDIDLY